MNDTLLTGFSVMLIRSGRTVLYPPLITLVIFKVALNATSLSWLLIPCFVRQTVNNNREKLQIITFVKLFVLFTVFIGGQQSVELRLVLPLV